MTPAAEVALVKAISTGRDGDAVYFWARTDGHAGTWHRDSSVEHPEDFWGYCDSVNSGRCRHGPFTSAMNEFLLIDFFFLFLLIMILLFFYAQ